MQGGITSLIIILICCAQVAYTSTGNTPPKTTLSGKIIDKASGLPVPGVSIYFPNLKTGTISDDNGLYSIGDLPRIKVLVQVSLTGYKMIAVVIDLAIVTTMDFTMEESINELNEIVITGLSGAAENNKTPTPISTIPQEMLIQAGSTNIIDAISREPGVAQITTGAGISKPVIRGLGYNRIVTVQDGVRQEGQQWGDEHGIEIDEFAVHKVEILKGPASLAFGSDALAGVIHLFSAPTVPEGNIEGNVLGNYQTNNGLIAYSANVAGNEKGLIWNARYSNKRSHAFQNKFDGYVLNSGFKENSISGIIGLNKSWGYSHLHLSSYEITPGIVEGDRDSATGKFINPIALNDTTEGTVIADESLFSTYDPLIPYQQVQHFKAVLNNSFILGQGSLKLVAGWQENKRREFGDILNPDQYGLYFLLHTFNYDVHYLFADKNFLELTLGVNGMQQSSSNPGTEFLIPEYDLFDIGFFGVAKKTIDNFDISLGLRYDTRDQEGDDLYVNAEGERTTSDDPEAVHQFVAFTSTYTGFSGSIGGTYQFSEKVFTKLNLSRGFRAPNIAEISSNGVHEGTINYIIGVPQLKPESSLQFDYAVGLNTEHVTGEIALFTSSIDNFIFLSKLESSAGGDSLTNGYSTFKYTAGNAVLSGGEASIDIHPHPLDWMHIKSSFSYVLAKQKGQTDSTKYLPFIPPAKWVSELRMTADKLGKIFADSYFSFTVENYFKQEKVYSAFGTETATPGYILINAGVGADIISKSNAVLFSIHIQANNITDVSYQSHLSRLKYAAFNNVTGRSGVYNMGRNVSLKVIVPFKVRFKLE